jgi:uncharacterized protein (TIGR02246 family)
MNLSALVVAASLTLAAAPAFAADRDVSAQSAAGTMLANFMAAWSASDATALASLFAPDADFINPWGTHASGREEIKAFYAGAFSMGYAGSRGEGDLIAVRDLGDGVAVIDGRWRITGAKNQDGSARADEKGILVAVIGERGGKWQILALRENTSATDVTPLAASTR